MEKSNEQTPQEAKFTPTGKWQEVPEGTTLPIGMEIKMNFTTGKNEARDPNLVEQDTAQSAPKTVETQTTETAEEQTLQENLKQEENLKTDREFTYEIPGLFTAIELNEFLESEQFKLITDNAQRQNALAEFIKEKRTANNFTIPEDANPPFSEESAVFCDNWDIEKAIEILQLLCDFFEISADTGTNDSTSNLDKKTPAHQTLRETLNQTMAKESGQADLASAEKLKEKIAHEINRLTDFCLKAVINENNKNEKNKFNQKSLNDLINDIANITNLPPDVVMQVYDLINAQLDDNARNEARAEKTLGKTLKQAGARAGVYGALAIGSGFVLSPLMTVGILGVARIVDVMRLNSKEKKEIEAKKLKIANFLNNDTDESLSDKKRIAELAVDLLASKKQKDLLAGDILPNNEEKTVLTFIKFAALNAENEETLAKYRKRYMEKLINLKIFANKDEFHGHVIYKIGAENLPTNEEEAERYMAALKAMYINEQMNAFEDAVVDKKYKLSGHDKEKGFDRKLKTAAVMAVVGTVARVLPGVREALYGIGGYQFGAGAFQYLEQRAGQLQSKESGEQEKKGTAGRMIDKLAAKVGAPIYQIKQKQAEVEKLLEKIKTSETGADINADELTQGLGIARGLLATHEVAGNKKTKVNMENAVVAILEKLAQLSMESMGNFNEKLEQAQAVRLSESQAYAESDKKQQKKKFYFKWGGAAAGAVIGDLITTLAPQAMAAVTNRTVQSHNLIHDISEMRHNGFGSVMSNRLEHFVSQPGSNNIEALPSNGPTNEPTTIPAAGDSLIVPDSTGNNNIENEPTITPGTIPIDNSINNLQEIHENTSNIPINEASHDNNEASHDNLDLTTPDQKTATSVVMKIGEGEANKYLEHAVHRAVINGMSEEQIRALAEDQTQDAVEAARQLNVTANLRELLTGAESVAGVRAEELNGVAEWNEETSEFIIHDQNKFNTIVQQLTDRADSKITSESEALAYTDNISRARWQEMLNDRLPIVNIEDYSVDDDVSNAQQLVSENSLNMNQTTDEVRIEDIIKNNFGDKEGAKENVLKLAENFGLISNTDNILSQKDIKILEILHKYQTSNPAVIDQLHKVNPNASKSVFFENPQYTEELIDFSMKHKEIDEQYLKKLLDDRNHLFGEVLKANIPLDEYFMLTGRWEIKSHTLVLSGERVNGVMFNSWPAELFVMTDKDNNAFIYDNTLEAPTFGKSDILPKLLDIAYNTCDKKPILINAILNANPDDVSGAVFQSEPKERIWKVTITYKNKPQQIFDLPFFDNNVKKQQEFIQDKINEHLIKL